MYFLLKTGIFHIIAMLVYQIVMMSFIRSERKHLGERFLGPPYLPINEVTRRVMRAVMQARTMHRYYQLLPSRDPWITQDEKVTNKTTTPRKTKMEPENTPLEEENHLPNHHFQVLC